MEDIALWTNETCIDKYGTYRVNIAQRDVPGYGLHNGGWKTLEAAQAYADDVNASNGLTKEEAQEIVLSSQAAQREVQLRELFAKVSGFTGMIMRAMAEHYGTEPESVFKDLEEAGVLNDLDEIGAQLEPFGY